MGGTLLHDLYVGSRGPNFINVYYWDKGIGEVTTLKIK